MSPQISSVKVDWAYALALSHHIGESLSQEDAGAEGCPTEEERV